MIGDIIVYAAFLSSAPHPASYIDNEIHLKDPTGICFRRIEWISTKGNLYSRYEVVLAKQSSSLKADIARINTAENDKKVVKSPHLTPYIWHHAWIDDRNLDFTSGPDCKDLPKIHGKISK